jgi:hypothetical protein
MPVSPFAVRLFERHLSQLKRHMLRNGVKGLDRLYKEARADLYEQLLRAGGKASKTPTAIQLKAMIAQVDGILKTLGNRVYQHLQNIGKTSAQLGAKHGVDEYKILAKHFTGTEPVLPLERAATFANLVSDQNASLLRRYQLVSQTWTTSAIHAMEQSLAVGTLAQKPLEDLIDLVMKKGGILDGERWKAERIVRTETSYAHGSTKFRTMKQNQEDLGIEMHKRLIATFDDRTGDDSFLVHGQTVPVDQPFRWKHKRRGVWVVDEYMHPPNRPNDREVVIPWDPKWEETESERPLTISELRNAPPTRWRDTVGVKIPPGHKPGKPA